MKTTQSLFYIGLAALRFTNAAHMALVGRSIPKLVPRAMILGDTGPLNDTSDLRYTTNITLGGNPYEVLIDTGSSDLWISGPDVPDAVGTGINVTATYAIGMAEGPVLYGKLEFAGYTVNEQAFFHATGNATNPLPAPGFLGLGPFVISDIVGALTTDINDIQGFPPLENMYRQNPNSTNYITIRLGRVADPDNNYPGDLTIMEILPGYEDIQNQPQIPVQTAVYHDQLWSILLDEDGIIGSDGKAITVETHVNATQNKKQLTGHFDTGFTYAQVPPNVAEAIYGSFNNAKLENISGQNFWTLSCQEEVNITIKMGGISYRINPLDATLPFSVVDIDREDCYGTFQGITTASNPDVDMVLGMPVLRNLYVLINAGNDFAAEINGTKVLNGVGNAVPAFVQLLSTSNDTTEIHSDFVKARLSGSSQATESIGHKIAKGIIIGAAVGGVVLLSLIVCCCFCLCRRRRSNSRGLSTTIWPGSSNNYRGLDEPAPFAAIDIHVAPYAASGSTAYHPPQYGTAWDEKR